MKQYCSHIHKMRELEKSLSREMKGGKNENMDPKIRKHNWREKIQTNNERNLKTLGFLHTFLSQIRFFSPQCISMLSLYEQSRHLLDRNPRISDTSKTLIDFKFGILTLISNVPYWPGSTFGIGQQEHSSKPKCQKSMLPL